ncbi:MAG: alpha/beta hydrolase [Pseudomonadota bacterium]
MQVPPRLIDTFQSQRLTLRYAEWGRPDAPPFLLVHGGMDQMRSWDAVAGHLSARYRVIAFDLRGHGQSQQVNDGDYGVMDHVFDVSSLVEHLELTQFHLMGHSLGGNIALRYAGLFPAKIEKLVALEGLGPSPKMLAERAAEDPCTRYRNWIEQRRTLSMRRPRVMADQSEAEGRMRARFSQLSDAQIAHLTATGLRENTDRTVSWAYDPAGMGRSPSDIPHEHFIHLQRQISCPTWLVYGADSWASNPEEDGRASVFQNATVTVIEQAGHWLHHDQFTQFIEGLDTFLAR